MDSTLQAFDALLKNIEWDLPMICKLLCCSRGMQAVVLNNIKAAYSADMRCKPDRFPVGYIPNGGPWTMERRASEYRMLVSSWLDHFGGLLQGLTVALPPKQEHFFSLTIRSIIQRITRQYNGLPLISLNCSSASDGHLLRALQGLSTLNHLTLIFTPSINNAARWYDFSGPLASLTALQSAQFGMARNTTTHKLPKPIIPGLSKLTQLSSLVLVDATVPIPDPINQYTMLPESLVSLDLGERVAHQVVITQLTGLTSLKARDIAGNDALAVSLVEVDLRSRDVTSRHRSNSHRPLLLLTALRRLRIDQGMGSKSVQQLSLLTQLSSLKELQVRWCDLDARLQEAAEPLASLPVKQLHLLQSDYTRGLGVLSRFLELTSLTLQDMLMSEVHAAAVAGQLLHLQGLQELHLQNLSFTPMAAEEGSGVTKSAATILLPSCKHMPSLRCLTLVDMGFANSSAVQALVDDLQHMHVAVRHAVADGIR